MLMSGLVNDGDISLFRKPTCRVRLEFRFRFRFRVRVRVRVRVLNNEPQMLYSE